MPALGAAFRLARGHWPSAACAREGARCRAGTVTPIYTPSRRSSYLPPRALPPGRDAFRRARIAIERGRVLNPQGDPGQAALLLFETRTRLPCAERSWSTRAHEGSRDLAAGKDDAPSEAVTNERAIARADSSSDPDARKAARLAAQQHGVDAPRREAVQGSARPVERALVARREMGTRGGAVSRAGALRAASARSAATRKRSRNRSPRSIAPPSTRRTATCSRRSVSACTASTARRSRARTSGARRWMRCRATRGSSRARLQGSPA